HLLGEGKLLRVALHRGSLPSLILWGPPGSGKTTLAFLIADALKAPLLPFSAVTAGIKEIKTVLAEAERQRRAGGSRVILLVDEIHRFNKAQQDAFLPHVERGTILLIGATTENPSFEVVAPLLSRARVLMLQPLSEDDLGTVIARALADRERGLGAIPLTLEEAALRHLVTQAAGDARAALNMLEVAADLLGPAGGTITLAVAEEAAQRRALLYDKAGEEHFNLISALHKSLRGSDPDAGLYWLARMLAAGEDPLYVARRLVRFAAEDVGTADPQALAVAVAAKDAYHFLGSPEGELALAECVCYLATAPKSNAVYRAYGAALEDVQRAPAAPVPMHLRNPVTPLMTGLGYGKDYRYPHDAPDALIPQQYLPDPLAGRRYYEPTDRGFEAEIRRRLAAWRQALVGRGGGADP
ncbi:MAG: replication-associated recombination protein A, partial [candidate division NC10 bacterium]|nr:replication-associated recombination protein A [candidate division NC10 bacterium]